MNYRLDRRFVLPAVGLSVMIAGVAAALAFFLSSVPALPWVFGVVVVVALLNAARTWLLPPLAVRTDETGLRLGRKVTDEPVRLAWRDVEDVSVDTSFIFIDAGAAGTLPLPLAHVGKRANELAREIYERLNTANGYRRFDPS